jgi:energy-coupling factor transport system substrate-specific component
MAEQAVRPSSDATGPVPAGTRWRTVDIVVTAVLGVAFGVVFWAWNLVFGVLAAPLDFFPPLAAILNGVYLMPAVVAGLLVPNPRTPLFATTLPPALSLLLGWA